MFRFLIPILALAWLSISLAYAADEEVERRISLKLDSARVERYVAAPEYSEGPTWRDGELFFCSGGLLKVTRERKLRKYLDISPAGTFLKDDGNILICDNKIPALLELSPNDGKVAVIVEEFEGKKLNSLNDLTVDKDGNVYWTDPNGSSKEKPIGNVFRVRPNGRVDKVATGLAYPNGLDVDPANRYLYLIESQTQKILRYDLPAEDKPLGKPTLFFDLGGSGGDGCAFDAFGNFWCADFHRPDTKKGRITVINPKGHVVGYLLIPAKQVSNITFGGLNRDQIFVTTGEPPGVFHSKIGVKGFKGHPGKKMRILRYLDLKPLDEPVEVK